MTHVQNTASRRVLCLLLALLMALALVQVATPSANAAYNSALATAVSAKLPLVTYAMPSSGASKVYSYSDSSLGSQTKSYYIDTFKDQIVITKISSNGKAVYVTYPSTSSSTGYRSRWFATNDILGLASVSVSSYTATAKTTTYRMSSSSAVASYGSIAAKDACVKLGSRTVGSTTYYPTIYPISSTTYNKVSGVKYKLAMSKTTGSTTVKLSSTSISLEVGSSATITATVTNGSGSTTWTSSNTSVATVSSGKVTAKATGTATITAKNNGVTATATVKVVAKTTDTATIVSASAIASAASEYGISTSSNAYKALQSINTKYYSKLTASQRSGTLIFFFEGVGSKSSSSVRMNAMCVVVKNNQIVYINLNSSTIPDYPFNPSRNEGTAMPTVKSGIYSFTTVNHKGKYAALNVTNAAVVRHTSQTSYYSDTSTGINIHRRDSNSIAGATATWVNSAGCLLVGQAGTTASGEYAQFIVAVGIVPSGSSGTATKVTSVSGKVIVDRTYATSYLKSIGYSTGAISLIG